MNRKADESARFEDSQTPEDPRYGIYLLQRIKKLLAPEGPKY